MERAGNHCFGDTLSPNDSDLQHRQLYTDGRCSGVEERSEAMNALNQNWLVTVNRKHRLRHSRFHGLHHSSQGCR